MARYSEHASDSLDLMASAVRQAVYSVMDDDQIGVEQAIKIVEIAAEATKADIMHHFFNLIDDGDLRGSLDVHSHKEA